MATILDSLREFAAPALVTALARKTGESESAISRGLSAAIPAIASTIAGRAHDTGFMTNLAELAAQTAAAPHPRETLGRLISSPVGLDTSTTTGGWLSSVFGQNLPGVTDRIANFAGIGGSSASSLLSVAAPLVLGYIGRLMRSENLNVAGLANLFHDERDHLAAAMPAGFTMPTSGYEPHLTVRTAADEAAFPGWATALVALIAALTIGGLFWWRAGYKPAPVARVDIVEPAERAVGTAGHVAGFARTLPGNVKVMIPSIGSGGSALDVPGFGSSRRDLGELRSHRVQLRLGGPHRCVQRPDRFHRGDPTGLSTGTRHDRGPYGQRGN